MIDFWALGNAARSRYVIIDKAHAKPSTPKRTRVGFWPASAVMRGLPEGGRARWVCRAEYEIERKRPLAASQECKTASGSYGFFGGAEPVFGGLMPGWVPGL